MQDAAAPSEDNTVAFDASSYTQARNAWGTEEHTDIHAAAKDATVAIEESEETIFGTTRKTIKLELIVSAANIVAPTSTPLDTLIVICTDQNLEQEAKRAQRSRKRPSKRETFKQGSSMQVRGGVISAKKDAPEAHTAEGDDAPEAERYPRDVDERPPFTLVPFATKKQTKTRPGPPRIRRRASVVNRDPMDMFGLPQQRPTSPPNPVKSDLPKDHDLVKPKEQWVEVARTEVCQGESSPNFIRFVNLTLRAVDNVLQQQRLMMTVVQVNSKGKPVATIGHATFGLQDLCRTRWGRMTLSMVPGTCDLHTVVQISHTRLCPSQNTYGGLLRCQVLTARCLRTVTRKAHPSQLSSLYLASSSPQYPRWSQPRTNGCEYNLMPRFSRAAEMCARHDQASTSF